MATTARQTVRILGLAGVLLVGWHGAVRWLPRPELAETNYVANRLRIERWMGGSTASNVIVGTSIGGRLLPAYFEGTRLGSVANLGLDGANPDTGLTLALARPTPPRVLFLEVHRLILPPGQNDRQLLALAEGPGLALAEWMPSTRADSRPSTVLYGILKRRQQGGDAASNLPRGPGGTVAGPAADPQWAERIGRKVKALQDRGTRVVLLRLPVGRENPASPEEVGIAEDASKRLGLPLVDLFRRSVREGAPLQYTDGLHLSPASAATPVPGKCGDGGTMACRRAVVSFGRDGSESGADPPAKGIRGIQPESAVAIDMG